MNNRKVLLVTVLILLLVGLGGAYFFNGNSLQGAFEGLVPSGASYPDLAFEDVYEAEKGGIQVVVGNKGEVEVPVDVEGGLTVKDGYGYEVSFYTWEELVKMGDDDFLRPHNKSTLLLLEKDAWQDWTLCLDIQNVIPETNEKNNCVWVGGRDDNENLDWHLVPTGDVDGDDNLPDLSVYELKLGTSNNVLVYAQNLGAVDVDPSTDGMTQVWANADLAASYDWLELPDLDFLVAGRESAVSTSVQISEESVVQACVDSSEKVEESNEDNNCLEMTLSPN